MGFTLYMDAEGSYEQFDDNASYRFTEGGLLQITEPADGEGSKVRTFSPNAWRYVEESGGKQGKGFINVLN